MTVHTVLTGIRSPSHPTKLFQFLPEHTTLREEGWEERISAVLWAHACFRPGEHILITSTGAHQSAELFQPG